MPTTEIRQRSGNLRCGLAHWHPEWMQRFANTKMFMAVYGLLGTIQAMSYMYFIVTLTTIEKRFKIPSQTTGIILSGNEISQILLSLILSYIGGQRNRPRWIAWGIVFCGVSCFILALPHFIYGAGEDALQLTKEYFGESNENGTSSLLLVNTTIKQSQQLCRSTKYEHECDALLSIVPLVLIFLSQFVLGIGNTLYYSLGQTYLDDNTKKTNTPLMLAVAMSLRMIGPIVGFFLGYVSLNMFIDPSKTPLIDSKDPRWLGAWWFGWMILGTLMCLFSGLIGLFPKELPKRRSIKYNSHMPQVLRHEELQLNEGLPLGRGFSSNLALDTPAATTSDFPTLKDFPKALMRLLRNKLLIFNIISGVFYILGAAGYMTFLTKYMEVQFHKNAQSATIIVGPVSIIGMVIGLIGSGLVISKKKPSPSKVLMWNVIVGCVYILGQISYMFMYCGDSVSMLKDGKLNLTTNCNSNCSCEGVPYSPICHEPTATTYFSACHAGCHSWDAKEKVYTNCSCLDQEILFSTLAPSTLEITTLPTTMPTTTPTTTPSFLTDFTDQVKEALPKLLQPLASTTFGPASTLMPSTTTTFGPSSTMTTNFDETTTTTTSTSTTTNPTTTTTTRTTYFDDFTTEGLLSRSRRAVSEIVKELKPGVCTKGCNISFWTFSIASMIVNWFGSSGRIGNLLVNYRSVSTEDKSFAQGLSLMMISLFALIPGPIIFGRIIDSTCLVWTKTCTGNGNCQLYDQTTFRYLVNTVAFSLTAIGVLFDVLVWYHGRNLDLYGEKEAQRAEEARRKNKAISPLLGRRQ